MFATLSSATFLLGKSANLSGCLEGKPPKLLLGYAVVPIELFALSVRWHVMHIRVVERLRVVVARGVGVCFGVILVGGSTFLVHAGVGQMGVLPVS